MHTDSWKLRPLAAALSLAFCSSSFSQTQEVSQEHSNVITSSYRTVYLSDTSVAQQNKSKPVVQIKERHFPTEFIVELYNEPVLSRKAVLQQTPGLQHKSRISGELRQYQSTLQRQQNTLISDALRTQAITGVIRQNSKVHNSVVVSGEWSSVRQLKSHPLVKAIYPSVRVEKFLQESTPLVNANDAWALTNSNGQALTGTGVTVAVIDTGVDYSHPDLGGCFGEGCKVIGGYDFVASDDDPMDVDGHGTHVAGIVAANGNLMGVAPDANIMAIKVLDDDGFGASHDIIAGIEYAVDPDNDPSTDDGADVINLSLGGPGDYLSPMSAAANAAAEAGVIVVAAAGNFGGYGDIASLAPSSALQAITVGSSTKNDEMSDFSSKGGGATFQQLKPEIVAPGSDIVSLAVGGGTLSLSGTSMASPHVAGAAAILKQDDPDATPQQIKSRLVTSATDIGADAYSQGYGRLDVLEALSSKVQLTDAGLALGRVDDTQDSLEYQVFIELANETDSDTTFDITLPTDLPEQVSIELAQTSLTVRANESVRLEFTVNVDSPADIATPNNQSVTYFSALQLSSDSQTIEVPVTLERGYRLSLTNDGLSPVSLSVDSVEGLNFSFDIIFPEETKTLFTPDTTVFVRAEHLLDEEEIPHLSIPEVDPDKRTIIYGYEDYVVQMNENRNINFSPSNMTRLVGLNEINNTQDEDVSDSSFTASTRLRSRIEFDDTFALRVEYSSLNAYNSEVQLGQVNAYMAVGPTAAEIDSIYVDHNRVPALVNEQSDTFVQGVYDISEQGEGLLSYSLNENNRIAINALESPLASQFSAGLSSDSLNSPHFVFATDKSEFFFSQISHGSVNESVELFLGETEEEGSLSFVPVVKSESFDFSNSQESDDSVIAVDDDIEYSFITSGLTLGKPIEVYQSVMELRGDHFYNGVGQSYFSGLNARYTLQCGEGQENKEGDFDARNYFNVQIFDCDISGLSFTWNTQLNNQSYQSFATYEYTDNTFPTYAGIITGISEDGVFNENAVIGGEENKLYISADPQFSYLNVESVEVKLDEGDWTETEFSDSDLTNYHVMAELPAAQNDSQVLSFRVSYQDSTGVNLVTQEINGAYLLQIEDGQQDSDLDGDGIPDSIDEDIDGDGIPNDVEEQYGLDPLDASDATGDIDNDGLTNLEEYLLGTSLNNPDTDGDGIPDAEDAEPLRREGAAVAYDFDNDGKADVAVRRGSNFVSYINFSGSDDIGRVQFGRNANDIPLSGDFDGDGIADIAVRRPSNQTWYIQNTSGIDTISGNADGITRIRFGTQQDDIPVVADFDGDGKTDIAVRRPSNQYWYILNSSGTDEISGNSDGITRIRFGTQQDDIPVVADYDGDGKADLAVRRPSNQYWYIRNSSGVDEISGNSDGLSRIRFGTQETDIPVPADYDGDGKADIAVRRPSNFFWYVRNSSGQDNRSQSADGISRVRFGGNSADIPVVADYDGDGKADFAVRRTSNQFFYIQNSSGDNFNSERGDGIQRLRFGLQEKDIPLAASITTKMAMAADN